MQKYQDDLCHLCEQFRNWHNSRGLQSSRSLCIKFDIFRFRATIGRWRPVVYWIAGDEEINQEKCQCFGISIFNEVLTYDKIHYR